MTPLANECSIDVSDLEAELSVAHNLVGLPHINTTEDFYSFLCSLEPAFSLLSKLVQAALTVPVSSASAERSFSALKRAHKDLPALHHE